MLVPLLLTLTSAAAVDAQLVREIRDSAQSEHGLIVVVGHANATLLRQLSDEKHLVHLLLRGPSANLSEIADLRKAAHRAGLAGRVTIDVLGADGLEDQKLFPPRTANVVVWRPTAAPTLRELTRVWKWLQPEGALWIQPPSNERISIVLEDTKVNRHASGWLSAVKPRSTQLDDWSHPRYNAAKTAASKDEVAGSPRGIRWSGGPLWPRGYRKSAVPAINVGPRQMVYVLQDEVKEAGRMVSRDSLVARDAFNGLPLWKRPAASPLIVTVGQRIFTVSTDRKVVELSARNGQQLREFNTELPKDIAVINDQLLVKSPESITAWSARASDSVQSIHPLWRHAAKADRFLADQQRVYFNVDETRRGGPAKVVALDLKTGDLLWERSMEPWEPGGADLVCTGEGVVVLAGRKGNHVLSSETGEHRWDYAYDRIGHGGSYEKVLIFDGLVWVHVAKSEDSAGPAWIGLDPITNKPVRRLKQPKGFKSKHRCSFDVATQRWLLCGSMDFANVSTGGYEHFAAARNSCAAAGVVPANGLVYSFPHACGCYPMLRGLLALSSDERSVRSSREPPAAERNNLTDVELIDSGVRADPLVKGPAFEAAKSAPLRPPATWQWSTYRGTSDRRGVSPDPLKRPSTNSTLQVFWKASTAKPLDNDALSWEWQLRDSATISPPVHAQRTIYVAESEGHRLVALDAGTGDVRWEFFAGARIEGPPTVVAQRCLFGARDGAAYCVRASDGQLVWKRTLVSWKPRIIAHGQLESAEPVRGASLVYRDTVMFVTGRHQSVGAGLWVHALDIATGDVRWQRRADGHQGVPDVLAGKGGAVQMGEWQSLVAPRSSTSPIPSIRQFIRGGRLGLHDNSWYQRPIAMRRNLQQWTTPDKTAGQLLCFDDQRSFAYRASERVLGANGLLFGKGSIEARFKDPQREPWQVEFGNASRVSGMVLAGDSLVIAGEFYGSLFSSRKTELRHFDANTGKLLGSLMLPTRPVHDGLMSDVGRLFVSLVNGEVMAVGFGEQVAEGTQSK